jgi:hypothetical protein
MPGGRRRALAQPFDVGIEGDAHTVGVPDGRQINLRAGVLTCLK